MNCPDILELQSFVDRQVTPDRQQALETHLAACAVCRHEAAGLRAMADALRTHIDAEALADMTPGGLEERLLQAVAAAPTVRHLSCRKVLPQLTAYLDGELSAATAAAVEAHTFTCEKCFTALSELRVVTETLAARQRAVPSEQLLARIMGALRREAAVARAPERTWQRRVAWQPGGLWQPLAAGLAAAVVLAAVIAPRFSSTPTWQPPISSGQSVAARPMPDTPVAEATQPATGTAQPTAVAASATVGQPGALQTLKDAFTGNHRNETSAAVSPRPASNGGGMTWPWAHSTPAPLATPDGGPVAASTDNALPAVAPATVAAVTRVAAMPTETPGMAAGIDGVRPRGSTAPLATEKPRPGDIALASRPTPAPAPEPELVPRRSARPAWEIYRSEGVDRERLAMAAERLNERGAQVRMANAKNIVIIH